MVGVLISITKDSINVGVVGLPGSMKWKLDKVWDEFIHNKSLGKAHNKIVYQVT